MNIPTAQQFLEDFNYKNQELGIDVNYPMIERCMVEFAKLHVAEALDETLESISFLHYNATYKDIKEVFLNAYPPTNIK
jgi:hypothetical protein